MPYDWGDGKGKKHSIPLSKHKKNVKTKKAARANDPAKFTAPRGATDVNRDADKATGLRYGEQERALGQQEQQVPAYYQAYRAQLAGIGQGIQQGYQKGAADVMARQQATAQSDTTARNTLGEQQQKDAQSRGATVDPSLLANDVNAANVRNTNSAAFANLLGAQGQAEGAYYGGLQASGSAGELEQKRRIGKEKTGLASEKGQYRSQYVTDARDSERKYGLERSAFDLDAIEAQTKAAEGQQKIKADAKKRKAAQRDKNQDQSLAGKKFRSAEEKKAYDRAHPKTDANGRTPAQKKASAEKRHKQTSRIVDAESRWNLYKTQDGQGPDGKVRKPNPGEIKQRLLGEHFTSQEIHLALMWSSPKPWTAKDRAIAKRLGIRLPKKKPVRTAKPRPEAKPVVNPFD